jgi:hypothetical protein
MNKIKGFAMTKVAGMSTAILGLSAYACAAETPSATTTLDTLMGTIINTTVSLATTIFTTYWPYVLVFGIIASLVGVFARFLHLGGKK